MIVITGASGHIGNNLVRLLIERDIPFKVLLRRDGHELAGLEIENILVIFMIIIFMMNTFKRWYCNSFSRIYWFG